MWRTMKMEVEYSTENRISLIFCSFVVRLQLPPPFQPFIYSPPKNNKYTCIFHHTCRDFQIWLARLTQKASLKWQELLNVIDWQLDSQAAFEHKNIAIFINENDRLN